MNNLANSSSVDLVNIHRLVTYVNKNTLAVERCSLNSVSKCDIWLSLCSIEYNVGTMHGTLYVDKKLRCLIN